MSHALTQASRLKPEIRLAQAVSQFEADLSNDQKRSFRNDKSELLRSAPDARVVMHLTAEIDSRPGSRGFGPRLTNFLQAVQQFAALGDIIIGGSQNLIACGVWSLVRMSLLVSYFPLPRISTVLNKYPLFVADCDFHLLHGQAIDNSYDNWPLSAAVPDDGRSLFPIKDSTIARFGIFYFSGSSLPSAVKIHAEVRF